MVRTIPTVTAYIGVIGPGAGATQRQLSIAHEVGTLLGRRGVCVVTGGLGGVMEAASEGAQGAGGLTLGLLPTADRGAGNSFLTMSVPTGLGEMRNALVVRASEVLISIGGGWGTLSEIAMAVRTGVPVISIDGWELPAAGVIVADSAQAAVALAMAKIRRSS